MYILYIRSREFRGSHSESLTVEFNRVIYIPANHSHVFHCIYVYILYTIHICDDIEHVCGIFLSLMTKPNDITE